MSDRAEEIAGVFGRAAPSYDTVVPFFTRFGARLVELAELRPGESVIDIGSGLGATLLPAAERVGPQGRVLGVDLSDEMVGRLSREIERRGLSQASARRMDAEALEVEADSFDVALSSFVLHLLPHPEVAAAELRRALRPGGRAAASVPAGAGYQWDFLGRLLRRYGPRATRPLAMPIRPDFDLAAVLVSAGLRVEAASEEQILFHFADEETWWAWAWSSGLRAVFEVLAPPDLEALREELFGELAALRTADGVPMAQSARFVLARES